MMLISVTAPFTSAGAGGGGGATTHAVEITNVFTPSNLTINLGDSVEWTNVASNPHTVTDMGTGPEPFDSGNMNNGDTFSFAPHSPGTYDYQCNYHTSMTGVIHVIDPNGGGPGSDENNTTGGGDNNNSNGSGGNGGTSNMSMRMMVYMPDGTSRITVVEMNNSGTLWDASQIGFSNLEFVYSFDNHPDFGVFLISIEGLLSDAEWGEDNYWHWGLYLMGNNGSWDASMNGVSDINASHNASFAWVATNGSWGPFDGHSVDQMIMDNENNGGNGSDIVSTNMMVYMPDGTSQYSNFSIADSANAWNASEMGFAQLGLQYNYTDDPTYGIYLTSIAGLISDAAWGDDNFWYWALYTTNATSGAWEASMLGVSAINVEEGFSFAWVATNGSWGPLDGNSVDQMIADNAANQEVSGCMDTSATNFNADATIDDGSCTFASPDPVLGCTDTAATNFNAEATEDDASCTYPTPDPVLGCTDTAATNFNAEATEDDGSCTTVVDDGNANSGNDGTSDNIDDKTEGVVDMIPGGIVGVGAIAAVVIGIIGWAVVSKN